MAGTRSSKRSTNAALVVLAEDRDIVRIGDSSSEAALQRESDVDTPDDARAFAVYRFASACRWPRGSSTFRQSPRRPEIGKSSQYAEPVQPRRSAAWRLTIATHMLIPLPAPGISGCQEFHPGHEQWVNPCRLRRRSRGKTDRATRRCPHPSHRHCSGEKDLEPHRTHASGAASPHPSRRCRSGEKDLELDRSHESGAASPHHLAPGTGPQRGSAPAQSSAAVFSKGAS